MTCPRLGQTGPGSKWQKSSPLLAPTTGFELCVSSMSKQIAQLSFENGLRYSKHVRKPQIVSADAISFTFSAQEKIRYSGTLLAMLNFGQVPDVGRRQVVVSNISALSKQVGRMILGMIRSDSIFRLKFSRDLWTWHSWMAQAPKHLRFHSIHVR